MFNGLVKVLARLAAAIERLANWGDDPRAAEALERTADAIERIEQLLEDGAQPPMADRCGEVGLQISIEDEPTIPQGGTNMSLAVAMNNRKQLRFSVLPKVVDEDGQQLRNTDGSLLTQDQVPVSWTVAEQTPSDPAAGDVVWLEDVAPNGQVGVVRSGAVGTAKVVGTIGPYPDGSTKEYVLTMAIGNSSVADPEFSHSIEDEPVASPTG